MNQVTLKVDGMMCGMCEAHVCDAIRKVCGEKAKVTASHTDGTAVVVMEGVPDVARIKHAVKETGYQVQEITVAPYEKKRFSLFGHKK